MNSHGAQPVTCVTLLQCRTLQYRTKTFIKFSVNIRKFQYRNLFVFVYTGFSFLVFFEEQRSRYLFFKKGSSTTYSAASSPVFSREKTNLFRKKNYTLFFISNTFIRNVRVKLAKNKTKAEQHPETELLTNMFKNKFVCINEIICLIVMKTKMVMTNRSRN